MYKFGFISAIVLVVGVWLVTVYLVWDCYGWFNAVLLVILEIFMGWLYQKIKKL